MDSKRRRHYDENNLIDRRPVIALPILSAQLPMILLVVLVGHTFANRPDRVSVLVQLAPGAARDAVRVFGARQGGHARYE